MARPAGCCSGPTSETQPRWPKFVKKFPEAKAGESWQQILDDSGMRLVTAAAVTCERARVGQMTMKAEKDYLKAKALLSILPQLGEVGKMVWQEFWGRVPSLESLGRHRPKAKTRPAWFFKRKKYGGILPDILSHQAEEFLIYTGSSRAKVEFARGENFAQPEFAEFQEFVGAVSTGKSGAQGTFRVDWSNLDGLRMRWMGAFFGWGPRGSWSAENMWMWLGGTRNWVSLVDGDGQDEMACKGKVGFPFFVELVSDCLNRTETAMTQERAFQAAELGLRAQEIAVGRGRL